MSVTNEELADTFLLHISKHQEKLLAYAASLCGSAERGHDLFQDTLIKCRDRIATHGFYGDAYVPYVVTAIKCNFYYMKRNPPKLVPLSALAVTPDEAEPAGADLQALARDIMSFITAHYSQEEAAVFELHVNGITHSEISYVTDFTYYQSRRIVKKIKEDLQATFSCRM